MDYTLDCWVLRAGGGVDWRERCPVAAGEQERWYNTLEARLLLINRKDEMLALPPQPSTRPERRCDFAMNPMQIVALALLAAASVLNEILKEK